MKLKKRFLTSVDIVQVFLAEKISNEKKTLKKQKASIAKMGFSQNKIWEVKQVEEDFFETKTDFGHLNENRQKAKRSGWLELKSPKKLTYNQNKQKSWFFFSLEAS